MENYAVAQNRIAELEHLLAALRGNVIPERAITVGPHWDFNRDTLHNRGATAQYVQAVDLATDQILGRLADPALSIPSPTEARVFIPAQSGKTAYISALAAKAVDAGYRLILVISPPRNALRNQLQTQLQESLAPVPDGGAPLLWITTNTVDFRPYPAMAQAMRLEKADPSLPLHDPANLGKTMASCWW